MCSLRIQGVEVHFYGVVRCDLREKFSRGTINFIM